MAFVPSILVILAVVTLILAIVMQATDKVQIKPVVLLLAVICAILAGLALK